MKIISRLGIVVLGFLLVFAVIHRRFYLKSDLDSYVTVLSNTNEAFIFVGSRTIGDSGSTIGILIKRLISIYPGTFNKRDDLIVVHIFEGKIQNTTLTNFGFSGGAFPLHGNIYFSRGSLDQGPSLVWKWNGTEFEKMDNVKAAEILNSFSFTETVIKAEGWKESRVKFNDGQTTLQFPMESGSCVLTLLQEASNGNTLKTIRVRGEGVSIHEKVLAEMADQSKNVTKSVYFDEFRSQSK